MLKFNIMLNKDLNNIFFMNIWKICCNLILTYSFILVNKINILINICYLYLNKLYFINIIL